MKYTLLFGFIVNLNLCFSQQIINGTIVDAATNEPLAYASLLIKNTNIGVLSDGDGSFELTIPEDHKKDSLVVNFIGYTSQTIAISDQKFKIKLTNEGNTIEQIVVTPIDADSIIKIASKRYVDNHIRNLNKQDGFIRIEVRNENDIFQIAETSYEVYYKEDEEGSKRIVKPLQSRMIIDSAIYKEMNSVFNFKKDEFLFEPTTLININQSFSRENSDKSNKRPNRNSKWHTYYEYIGKSEYMGREVYEIRDSTFRKNDQVIDFTRLIDTDTFAYTSLKYETTNEEEIIKLIPLAIRTLISVMGYKFYINKISGNVYYRYNGEFFELDKGAFYLSGGISKGGEWIKGSLLQEFYLQESQSISTLPEIEKDYSFKSEIVTDFEPNYFNSFHLPTSKKTIKKVVEIDEKNKQFSGEIYSERHQKWLKKQERKKQKKD